MPMESAGHREDLPCAQDTARLRAARLSRRFGLVPAWAALIAALAWGSGE